MKTEHNCIGRDYMKTKHCKDCRITSSCRRELRGRNINKLRESGGLIKEKRRAYRRDYIKRRFIKW